MNGFTAVVYPADTIKSFEDYGKTKDDFLDQAGNNATYIGNQGYQTPSAYLSPDYELTVNKEVVPVYCTLVYVGSGDGYGVLHSYAMIDLADRDMELSVTITALNNTVTNAVVLPGFLNVRASVGVNNTITATVKGCGMYTFVTNDSTQEVSQATAFTLFVREWVDEEAEIADFQKRYGADHVIVYEPGAHVVEPIHLGEDDMVLYLRAGSYLIPEHDENVYEGNKPEEPDAVSAIKSRRWPVISAAGCRNIRITGRGTVDFGRLDFEERASLCIIDCRDVVLEGITLLNPPGWAITAICTENLLIHEVAIMGYKTCSDGFAVCNSQNASVSNCFARSGDDLFEVKTLYKGKDAAVRNVTFTDCYAWAGKARCFGLTHETRADVSDVLFKHCAILFRDATWDNSLLGGLVVLVGDGEGNVSNITFEDIEIYHDAGHPILVANNRGDSPANRISGILFKDISYSGDMKILLHTHDGCPNTASVAFENVVANQTPLTAENSDFYMDVSGSGIEYTII